MRPLIFITTIAMLAMSIAAIPYPDLPSLDIGVGNPYRLARGKEDVEKLDEIYQHIMAVKGDKDKLVQTLLRMNEFFTIFERLPRQTGLAGLSSLDVAALQHNYDELHKDYQPLFRMAVKLERGVKALSLSFENLLLGIESDWKQYEMLVRAIDLLPFLYNPAIPSVSELRPLWQTAFCRVYAITRISNSRNFLTKENSGSYTELHRLLHLESEEAKLILKETDHCEDSMLNWRQPPYGAQLEPEKSQGQQQSKGKQQEGKIRTLIKSILAAPKWLMKKILTFLGLLSEEPN